MSHSQADICIVSCGGVFPDARNPEQFFEMLMRGDRAIKDVRDPETKKGLHHDLALFYNSNRKAPNRAYSPWGSFIDRRWTREFARNLDVDPDKHTTAELVAAEAARQTLEPLRGRIDFKEMEIILGAAAADGEDIFQIQKRLLLQRLGFKESDPLFAEFLKDLPKASVQRTRFECATSPLDLIRKKYGIRGISYLTDAACAASFSAFYCAVRRIRHGHAPYVLTGGFDTNLNPFYSVMFAKLGVVSDKRTKPFDVTASGMNCGEAAALFVLTTVDRAEKADLPILGVISHCDGSSDGLKGGATEPTFEGQVLAYRRVHGDQAPPVHYIETHGTGTTVGDRTEIRSLEHFFGRRLPIGSVKSNVGHTIGAAGAVSLMKCLKILQHRVVPPSKYFSRFPNAFKTQLFVNTEPYPLPKDEQLSIAISSFGFGGTNFHLHLREYQKNGTQPPPHSRSDTPKNLVLCADETVYFTEIPELLASTQFRIPPKTVPHYDPMVLCGFLGVEKALRTRGISLIGADRDRIATVAGGAHTLDLASRIMAGLACDLLLKKFAGTDLEPRIQETMRSLPTISADTGPSVLNNLVAGRAAKMFDFHGVNFHVDSDLGSRFSAFSAAEGVVQSSGGAAFILSAVEEFDSDREEFVRKGLRIELLSDYEFARQSDWPILAKLEKLEFQP